MIGGNIMNAVRKVPISMRALVQRINRALPDGQQLKTPRGHARSSLGDFYVLNIARSWIVKHHVDPVALARELECLQPWEEVVGE
jgi:hypothetical protein